MISRLLLGCYNRFFGRGGIVMSKSFIQDAIVIDEALTDGRLTQKSNISEKFNLRAAILLSKRLGRILTNEEIRNLCDSDYIIRKQNV